MTDPPDVHSSLAEMDRKLRELQRELAMVSGRPEPSPRPPSPGREAPAPAGPASTATPAAPLPGPRPQSGLAYEQQQAQQIVADARATAARIVEDVTARVGEMGRQIDELQRLRVDLERSTRDLARQLGRPVDQARSATPAAAPPPPVPPPPPPPSWPSTEPQAPRISAEPLPADAGREYEGTVVVNAGPFTDIATLGAFEQALRRLPGAEEVYVRSFEGNRALIDLKLRTRVRLVEELRRTGFAVVEVGHGMVTIDVDQPAGGSVSPER
jgi:hypothetical protein